MSDATQKWIWKPVLNKPARLSYWFMVVTVVLAGWFRLATPLLAALFCYFALRQLRHVCRSRWFTVVVFVILLSGVFYGLGFFINQTVKALPEIADKAIPSFIQTARHYQVEMSFTDYESLKDQIIESITSQARYLGSFARLAREASTEVVLLIVGIVVAIGVFLDPRLEYRPESPQNKPDINFYSASCDQIKARFSNFYRSFATVMGAQIIISTINTLLTAIFVVGVDLPYPLVVVGVTFLCGLLPVIGNLISNTIIVGIGFTLSPRMALLALLYLVIIHKLEYFLNSKIVGDRIRNPLWLTMLGLVLGERLMGIPGMILAPVLLHYVKTEASLIKAEVELAPSPALPSPAPSPASISGTSSLPATVHGPPERAAASAAEGRRPREREEFVQS